MPTLGMQRVKSVSHYKHLGIVLDIEFSDDKDIQRQLWCQYYAVNNCELLFLDVWTQWKMYFFVPSLRPCMHHNYGVISGRHTSTNGVWLITLVAELCRTCRGERVLVVIRFNVTFLPLRLYREKMCTCFLKKVQKCMVRRFDAVRLFISIFVLILWTLQPHFTLWLSAQRLHC